MDMRPLAIVDVAYEEDIRGPFPQAYRTVKLLTYLSRFLKVQLKAIPAAPVAGALTAAQYREHSDWLHDQIREINPTHILMLGKGATYVLSAGFPERLAKRRKWERLIGRKFLFEDGRYGLVSNSPSTLYASKNGEDAGYLQLRTSVEHLHALISPEQPTPTPEYTLLDADGFRRYLAALPRGELVACDIETTGLNFLQDTIFSIQFSHAEHKAVVVPWDALTVEQWRKAFEYIQSKQIQLVGQNFKFDAKFLMRQGIGLSPWLETSVMHIVEDERPGTHNLDFMSIQLLGEEKDDVDVQSFRDADLASVKDYAAKDADLTRRIATTLSPVAERPIVNIMVRAGYALAQAEHFGIRVDQALLADLVQRAEDGLLKYQGFFDAHGVSGHSDRTGIARVLGLAGTTSKDVLEPLAAEGNEFARAVIDARGLGKVLQTYLRRIQAGIQFDGRYHADFRLAGPSTGRTSCGSGKPPPGHDYLSINMQNIPRPQESGHDHALLSEALRARLRDLFIADEGSVLVGADFSAAEFRVAAALSKDPQMILDCNNRLDTHSVIAINAFNLPITVNLDDPSTYKSMKKAVEEQFGYQRTIAKRGTFAALYGGSEGTIAANTGCTTAQAKSILSALYGRYPLLREYFDRCHADVRAGRVVSHYGRVRRFPYSTGVFGRESQQAMLREGQNFTIQSTASDYGLKALGDFHAAWGHVFKPLLFVHDAIYVQAPEDRAEEAKFELQRYMEAADNLNGVVLYADAKSARRWGEL